MWKTYLKPCTLSSRSALSQFAVAYAEGMLSSPITAVEATKPPTAKTTVTLFSDNGAIIQAIPD